MKKKYGQNFLKDRNLLHKIVKSSDIAGKTVIEIGPGQGAMTGLLATEARHVYAYEIDTTLKPFLDQIEQEHPNLDIIYEDILKADMNRHGPAHVVANVPYYITTPILFNILAAQDIKTASLMVQKEVCDRLLAKPGTKAYNALSVLLQYQADVYKMMDVKRQLFYPVPNVDSAVIRIIKHETATLDEKSESRFIKLVKAAFTQKRKTLVNNWHQAFGIEKTHLETWLDAQGISPLVRAEALTLETFVRLAREWPHD